jgi:hypothetical protein
MYGVLSSSDFARAINPRCAAVGCANASNGCITMAPVASAVGHEQPATGKFPVSHDVDSGFNRESIGSFVHLVGAAEQTAKALCCPVPLQF